MWSRADVIGLFSNNVVSFSRNVVLRDPLFSINSVSKPRMLSVRTVYVLRSLQLGNGKWSAGPSLVVLATPGHWVIGALANNQWSFVGWGKKSVDEMLVQPFVNYNFPHGWYVTSSPIITANWEAASDERWTVPIGAGVGKIIKIDKLPINTSLQAFCNVVTPQHSGADWQLRFQVQFLFPK